MICKYVLINVEMRLKKDVYIVFRGHVNHKYHHHAGCIDISKQLHPN